MSRPSWAAQLTRSLSPAQAPPRVAVVGIGHELRGDDAAGLAIVRALQRRHFDAARWLLLEGGPAPENHTGALRRFAPDIVLLIDAAQMDEPPGTIRLLPPAAASGPGASTHTFSLSVLTAYLTHELDCEIVLVGIQPATLALGAPLSLPVAAAVGTLVEALAGLIAASPGVLEPHTTVA